MRVDSEIQKCSSFFNLKKLHGKGNDKNINYSPWALLNPKRIKKNIIGTNIPISVSILLRNKGNISIYIAHDIENNKILTFYICDKTFIAICNEPKKALIKTSKAPSH